eukprot:768759-Hanusia_phi.AAC.24
MEKEEAALSVEAGASKRREASKGCRESGDARPGSALGRDPENKGPGDREEHNAGSRAIAAIAAAN